MDTVGCTSAQCFGVRPFGCWLWGATPNFNPPFAVVTDRKAIWECIYNRTIGRSQRTTIDILNPVIGLLPFPFETWGFGQNLEPDQSTM